MNKRKQAPSSKARGARGGSERPARPAGRGRTVARGTKSSSAERPHPPIPGPAAGQEALPAVLTLSAECTVSEVTSLKQRLAPLLEESSPVTLDVGALQRIDTAGLQVITAFVRERAGHGRAVEWQGTAPVLATAARLLGLTSLLKLPS